LPEVLLYLRTGVTLSNGEGCFGIYAELLVLVHGQCLFVDDILLAWFVLSTDGPPSMCSEYEDEYNDTDESDEGDSDDHEHDAEVARALGDGGLIQRTPPAGVVRFQALLLRHHPGSLVLEIRKLSDEDLLAEALVDLDQVAVLVPDHLEGDMDAEAVRSHHLQGVHMDVMDAGLVHLENLAQLSSQVPTEDVIVERLNNGFIHGSKVHANVHGLYLFMFYAVRL